jgi:hypothetical protein
MARISCRQSGWVQAVKEFLLAFVKIVQEYPHVQAEMPFAAP